MVSLRDRTKTRFAVLPPANLAASGVFRNIESNPHRYDYMVAEMQRLRGAVYAKDGAIQKSDLTADGRHRSLVDERSWHVLHKNDRSGEFPSEARRETHHRSWAACRGRENNDRESLVEAGSGVVFGRRKFFL